MSNKKAGYLEREHTADWELEAWAPDLSGLLEQAARGMYALSGVTLKPGPRLRREITLHALDAESLLVRFLSELLYYEEQERIGFDSFNIQVEGENILHARLEGAPIAEIHKEIKAVTYHNLVVRRTDNGLETSLVFDV